MTKLLSDLDAAIESCAENKLLKSLHSVLKRAREQVAAKVEARSAAEITTAESAWRAYRAFDERLTKVVTQLVQASAPEAQGVFVSDWSRFGHDDHEQLSVRVRYRLYSGPEYDKADEEDRLNVSAHDVRYLECVMQLYVKPSWLWTDGWQHEAEKRRLEEQLARTTRDAEYLSGRILDEEKQSELREKKLADRLREVETLSKQLAALAEESAA